MKRIGEQCLVKPINYRGRMKKTKPNVHFVISGFISIIFAFRMEGLGMPHFLLLLQLGTFVSFVLQLPQFKFNLSHNSRNSEFAKIPNLQKIPNFQIIQIFKKKIKFSKNPNFKKKSKFSKKFKFSKKKSNFQKKN